MHGLCWIDHRPLSLHLCQRIFIPQVFQFHAQGNPHRPGTVRPGQAVHEHAVAVFQRALDDPDQRVEKAKHPIVAARDLCLVVVGFQMVLPPADVEANVLHAWILTMVADLLCGAHDDKPDTVAVEDPFALGCTLISDVESSLPCSVEKKIAVAVTPSINAGRYVSIIL